MGKNQKQQPATNNKETYMEMGKSLGMCFGTAISIPLTKLLGSPALSYGLIGGLVIGGLVGMRIKKSPSVNKY